MLNRDRENRALSSVFISSSILKSSALFCSFRLTSFTMKVVVAGERIQLLNLLNLAGMLTLHNKNTASRSSTEMMKTIVK